jgi:hypothetical protein
VEKPPRSLSLSAGQARRTAIAAQGLSDRPTVTALDRRHLRRVLKQTSLLQIDSVNVLTRAHYLPAFSRLGPYPTAALDDMAFRHRELFEYWGHAASYLPVELHPLLRWRMKAAEAGIGSWGRVARLAAERPGYIEAVYDEVVARGPVSAGQVAEDQKRGTDEWGWNWTDAKVALEHLFWAGRITTASRPNFERLYDIPERVLPRRILDLPTPDRETAQRELLVISARSLGVATLPELADYFRLRVPQARPRVAELVEDDRLIRADVAGWPQPAYLLPDTTIARKTAGAALLAPFDPLIWERGRTERLFDFVYRIEIYVPAPKRMHGYYVLPFLLGDQLVARVDLKADRSARVLLVQSAYGEPGAPAETADELAAQLRSMAGWLGLDDVLVRPRGDLAPVLTTALSGWRG